MKLPTAVMNCAVALCAAIGLMLSQPALAQKPALAEKTHNSQYDALVAAHAQANGLPESLIHRVIRRESGYRAGLIGRGGTIGLMQIKLGTARSLGYTGTAEGLRDPVTNLTYAVKYLAGAFLAARGDHDRAVAYYAGGYYYVAKRQRATRHAAVAKSRRSIAAAPPATEAIASASTAAPPAAAGSSPGSPKP
ncbi:MULTISPECIES: lytic transglycosylase domain-containing protein [Rhodopseudomonas]|uniref:lytic transglycosylase domain-containing protein n=1 Tax=Rhodopseudomonas TaxID=1073 RepID=UPI000B0BB7AD|nr:MULTISPECIES: lytic transglycosylase domain-containing protein [Rhodopseudomonas]MDF3813900.1 lytic transglycosylase domain-containing protein [Rhodopseudomonas sp. BAL398]WOK18289.1 lytic transglycosylase domain-containing protein [Rhodopseudomonas sp. BAL398]